MKQPVKHDKINPALGNDNAKLEDALFLHADKLLALCQVQAAWASADYLPSPTTRNHYSLIIEEQALELRRLLGRVLG